MVSVKECENIIKPFLSEERFYHSRCVSKKAGELAEKYGADVYKAEIAGMLHDIMKDTDSDEQLKIINRFGIMMSNDEFRNKKLYHAISGYAYVKNILRIDDEEILGAIRWHTSGKQDMNLLEKVIFVADYISADRDYPGVDQMRELADKSLELAMVEGISYTVTELINKGKYVDVNSICAYNSALEIVKRNNS